MTSRTDHQSASASESDCVARTFHELASIAAIYGEDAPLELPEPWLHALTTLDASDEQGLAAWCAAHAGLPCSGTLRTKGAALAFTLPPAYPAPGAAAAVHVASDALGRGQCAALSSQLQVLAAEAAVEGRECLHDVAQALTAELERCLSAPATAPEQARPAAAAAAAGAAAAAASEGAGLQVVLLRLDHMRDRARYSRKVRQWAGELGLTGRLLSCHHLILVVLEGEGAALKAYLKLQRTVSVDVDASGRKCRERMMDVLLQRPALARCFPDFREVTLEDLKSLAEELAPATGLSTEEVVALTGWRR